MRDVLVIGIGNPLRGDDGIGWHVVRALCLAPYESDVGLRTHVCHQLTPELAAVVAGVERVVFVDAAMDVVPGRVQVRRVRPRAAGSRWSHGFAPPDLLDLAARLYASRPAAIAVAIGVASVAAGEQLSAPVTTALPDAVAATLRAARARSLL